MAKQTERWGDRATGGEAASDIVAKRFIKGTGYAARGERADGVSVIATESGKRISLHVTGDVNVTADGTVTAGDEVTSGENGKAIKKYADRTLKKKAADESKASTTTLADDAELKAIEVAKGLIYKLTGNIAVANGDDSVARTIKWKLDVPEGASAKGRITGASAVDGNITLVDENADLTAEQTQEITADDSGIVGFEGYFDMGTADNGQIAFQWAPFATTTNLMDVQAGSLIDMIVQTPQNVNGVAKSTNTDGDVLVRLK
jgi:hypothetical protein